MDILLWRNDPVTRKSFFNNRLIKREEHEDWFQKIMKSNQFHHSIIIFNGKDKIGVVRFDAA